jgi:hypothetical protein
MNLFKTDLIQNKGSGNLRTLQRKSSYRGVCFQAIDYFRFHLINPNQTSNVSSHVKAAVMHPVTIKQ